MPWWGWLIIGAILFGSELLIVDAAFYLVFLGAAAIITGLLVWLDLGIVVWAQWLIFGGLSLFTMVLFRRKLYDKLRGNVPDYKDGPGGDFIIPAESLKPGQSCRQEFRGTTWTVVNRGNEVIESGVEAKIHSVDGLTLILK